MSLCKLCDGVKGPTICKINFTAFHNNMSFSPSGEPSQLCEKFKFYIHCLLFFNNCMAQMCRSTETHCLAMSQRVPIPLTGVQTILCRHLVFVLFHTCEKSNEASVFNRSITQVYLQLGAVNTRLIIKILSIRYQVIIDSFTLV